MFKKWLGIAAGAIALVGVAGVLALNGSRTSQPAGEAAEKLPAHGKVATLQDTDRALRDLKAAMATPKDGSRWDAAFWGSYDFEQDDAYRVFFFALNHIAADGSWDRCIMCGAVLAAVTYRKNGESWEIATKDLAIAEIGSHGRLPPADDVFGSVLGTAPVMVFAERATDRGYSVVNAHFVAYRGGWKSFGRVMTSDGNANSTECTQRQRCYSWKGEIRILASESNGYPELTVERHGTQLDAVSGVSEPANVVRYQFTGVEYQEVHEMPATATSSPARPPVVMADSGSAAASPPARQWYTPDVNFTRCFKSRSPAERIHMIQDYGKHPKVVDLPGGAVEVAEQTTTTQEEVWTYYPSEEACTAALPRSQRIPNRYR